jgi:hypothetical protein
MRIPSGKERATFNVDRERKAAFKKYCAGKMSMSSEVDRFMGSLHKISEFDFKTIHSFLEAYVRDFIDHAKVVDVTEDDAAVLIELVGECGKEGGQ